MGKHRKSLVPGFILIFIGLWMFASNHHYFHNKWGMLYRALILLFAAVFFIDAIRGNKSNMIFWGTTFSIAGAFFFLRNFNVIPYYEIDEYWPVFLIALGAGFFSLFLLNLKDWGALVPAALFLFLGIGFSLTHMLHTFWDFENFIEKYWPVLLIFIGVGLMANGFLTHTAKTKNE